MSGRTTLFILMFVTDTANLDDDPFLLIYDMSKEEMSIDKIVTIEVSKFWDWLLDLI